MRDWLPALVAIRLSAKLADAKQPSGHSKAEYLSTMLERALVVISAPAV